MLHRVDIAQQVCTCRQQDLVAVGTYRVIQLSGRVDAAPPTTLLTERGSIHDCLEPDTAAGQLRENAEQVRMCMSAATNCC